MARANIEQLRFVSAWLREEEEAGRYYGKSLVALPTGMWRSELQKDPNLRRYGTLHFALKAIHEDLFEHPIRARERAAIVVDFAPAADAPLAQYRTALAGLAWKEYANALRYAGEFPDAIQAALRSQEIYDSVGTLAIECAKAKLVEALARRDVDEHDLALSLARSCARVFLDFGDSASYVHARMTEALVRSDCKRYSEALAILSETAADAERRGDKHTLAICLHNSAECARALGDLEAAKALDARALAHFDDLGTKVDRPRVRWTYSLSLADQGRVQEAIWSLYETRAEFLALGMNGEAAACNLDIVRLRHARGENVTDTCSELVETFVHAGMTQPSIEALAYIREEARHNRLTERKIRKVRDFVSEAAQGPPRMFLPPPDDDEHR